jgi:hypothetical protein
LSAISINSGLDYAGKTFSGRVTGIAADPTNANIVYVAAAGGGVWKTTDAENSSPTWTPLTDNIPGTTDSMGAIAIAPSYPHVLYAGTGEANNSVDSNYGEGILVTKDGGSTWTLENPGGMFTGLTVSKIAVDPTNADVAYAAVGNVGENKAYIPGAGLYKTTDGGVTWTNTTAAITTSAAFSDAVLDPSSPSTVYAAVGAFYGDAANGIYKSTDGGGSWTLLTGFPNGISDGRISLAISPSNPLVLYAVNGALVGVEESTDGGNTWTYRQTPYFFTATDNSGNILGGSQGDYDLTIAVDPTSPSTVYIGGSEENWGMYFGKMYESTDGGANWTEMVRDDTLSAAIHPDIHAFTFDASNRLLVGSDGGVYRRETDPNPGYYGFLWSDLNGDLNTIQFYGIAISPTNPQRAVGGSQDNGLAFWDGTTWKEEITGDGGPVRYSQQNGNLVYATLPPASVGSDCVKVSTDGGSTWSTGNIGFSTLIDYSPALAVDPNDGTRVAVAADQLLLGSTDSNGKVTWTQVTQVGTPVWNPHQKPVDSIALVGKTIYASTGGQQSNSSQVFVSTNGGATWAEDDLPGGSGHVSQILADPTNPSTAYAVVNRFTSGAGHVFKTTDDGQSWIDVTGNLPNLPTWSIQADWTKNVLYVGTDDGVYASANNGSTWSRFCTGLPYAQVFSLDYNAGLNILAAGTHGRGMWEASPPPFDSVTVTAANASANFSTQAQTINLSATVVDRSHPGTTVGEGAVTFTVRDGSNQAIGSAQGNVSGGKASAAFSLPADHAGNYTIAVNYADGQGTFLDGGDDNGTLTIPSEPVTVTAADDSANFNGTQAQTISLSATVVDSSHPGVTVGEGVVTFTVKDAGNHAIGNVQGNVSGGKAIANFSLAAGQAAGKYTIAVSYADSLGTFVDGGDTDGTLTVTGGNVTVTAGNASAVYSPSVAEFVSLSARVVDSADPGVTVNEGVVTFTVLDAGNHKIGSAQGAVFSGNANAFCYLPAGQPAGAYTIAVGYADGLGEFVDGGDHYGTLTVTGEPVTVRSGFHLVTFNTQAQLVALDALVTDGGTVPGEGVVTFTVLDASNHVVGTAQGTVQAASFGGSAHANFLVPGGLAPGFYVIAVGYADSPPNYVDAGDYNSTLQVLPGTGGGRHPLRAQLFSVRVGKHKTRLMVEVFDLVTGGMVESLVSPFQSPAYRAISLVPLYSPDGTLQSLLLTARKGKREVAVRLPV